MIEKKLSELSKSDSSVEKPNFLTKDEVLNYLTESEITNFFKIVFYYKTSFDSLGINTHFSLEGTKELEKEKLGKWSSNVVSLTKNEINELKQVMNYARDKNLAKQIEKKARLLTKPLWFEERTPKARFVASTSLILLLASYLTGFVLLFRFVQVLMRGKNYASYLLMESSLGFENIKYELVTLSIIFIISTPISIYLFSLVSKWTKEEEEFLKEKLRDSIY